MASIYRRTGSPYYWVIYYLNGAKHARSLKVRNKEVAIRLRNKLEERIALGEVGMSAIDEKTIEEYKTEFFGELERQSAPRTVIEYKRTLNSFTEFLKMEFPDVRMLSQIADNHIHKYLAHRMGAVTATTRNNDLTRVKHFLNKAKLNKYIKSNPAEGIGDLRVARMPRPIYSERDIRLMLEKAPKNLSAMFMVLLQTGLRKAELIHLEWSDVKFDRGFIAVTVKSDFIPKDKECREIPLREQTRKALMELGPGSGRIFPGVDRHLDRTFKKFFNRIGIKGNVKIFRHTFASYSLGCGIPLQNVQKYLGHSDIETTQVYLSTIPDKISEGIKEIFGGK